MASSSTSKIRVAPPGHVTTAHPGTRRTRNLGRRTTVSCDASAGATRPGRTVAKVRRDGQLPLLADAHIHKPAVPACRASHALRDASRTLDHHPRAELELKRLVPVEGAVKLGPILPRINPRCCPAARTWSVPV